MSCSPFDLRDYWFDELQPEERRQVEAHLDACAACREELDRLNATRRVLLRLKDEEIPRRIAFVSDKVFEPSPASRWWAILGGGFSRFAVAAALLLAVFFGGAAISKPNVTIDNGRWQIAFGGEGARFEKAMAAMEARHAAELRNAEQAYEMVTKQLNELYKATETRPAVFRQ